MSYCAHVPSQESAPISFVKTTECKYELTEEVAEGKLFLNALSPRSNVNLKISVD